jgi:SNF2 family DNA or RNA helicase
MLSCGLGKTLTTLKAIEELLLDRFEITRALIIAPLRVCKVWQDEIEKWNIQLRINIATGNAKERAAAFWKPSDIVAINRENVVWAAEMGLLEGFCMMVIDESSSFKALSAKRTKILIKERIKFERIVMLSATPGDLLQLFPQYRILDGGQRLGRFIGQFREQYFKPDKTNGNVVYSYKLRCPENEQEIYDKVKDITVSMKSVDYLDMPELVQVTHKVYLTEKERKLYDELKKELTIDIQGEDISAVNAASLCNKLCQMANGFLYREDKTAVNIHDHKLDALEDLIEQQNGKPLLVFYWFKEDYRKICERLDKLKIPYGNIADKGGVEKWNNQKFLVGLAQTGSISHGVNIQNGGCSMVYYSLPWSHEVYVQSLSRLYRQGQRSKTVVVHSIITDMTIDTRIREVLECKEETHSKLIEAVKAEVSI